MALWGLVMKARIVYHNIKSASEGSPYHGSVEFDMPEGELVFARPFYRDYDNEGWVFDTWWLVKDDGAPNVAWAAWHHGHRIVRATESHSQIPICRRCNRDLTDQELRDLDK
jgi:hypothetical protein